MSDSRLRVLIAKPGLDGHDRGAKVIAFFLRDAGCEVIYLGLRSTSTEIMEAAAAEDVDLIGASILSGAHLPLAMDLLNERALHGLDDVPIVIGGIVPPRDIERLLGLGIADVFPAGTPVTDLVDRVLKLGAAREAGPA